MEKKKTGNGLGHALVESLAMGLAPAVLAAPACLILVYMDRLGFWWFPLLIAYFALFFAAQGYILVPKRITRLHHEMGSEMFYRLFPEELKKALRRIRKVSQPEREQVLAAYRDRLTDTDADERGRKYAAAAAALYIAGGLIVLGLAIWCLYSFARGMQAGEDLSFARVLRLVSAAMLLAVSVAVLRRSRKMIPQTAAGIVLAVEIWANLANKIRVPKRYPMTPVWEGLTVLAVFLFAGVGLVMLAGCLMDRSRTHRTRQEFDLALYELGVIDEAELAYRFSREALLSERES